MSDFAIQVLEGQIRITSEKLDGVYIVITPERVDAALRQKKQYRTLHIPVGECRDVTNTGIKVCREKTSLTMHNTREFLVNVSFEEKKIILFSDREVTIRWETDRNGVKLLLPITENSRK